MLKCKLNLYFGKLVQAYELYVFFLDHKKQMIFKKMNYIARITFIMCENFSYEL